MQELRKMVIDALSRIKLLENRRITQAQVVPDVIKMRHMGEGIRFIRGGVAAGKPTTGEEPSDSAAVYFDTTNNKLYIWNSSSQTWKSVTLS